MRGWLLGAVLAFATAGTAFAGPPIAVTIDAHEDFDTGGGTFTASGGGLCPSGTIANDAASATGWQSDRRIGLHVLKTFTCADGSGTFTVRVEARYVFGDATDAFRWVVVGGTGDHASLNGAGSGVGTELGNGVDDHYVGKVGS